MTPYGLVEWSPSRLPKMPKNMFSEWLAGVSRNTPASIATIFHLSKSSHLSYRNKFKIELVFFLFFNMIFACYSLSGGLG